jgi:RNA polymerase sigma factor (sigma-70 family)
MISHASLPCSETVPGRIADDRHRPQNDEPASFERTVVPLAPNGWKGPAHAQHRKLHERLAPVVNGMVWILMGPDRDRDDIVQDAFVRIFEGLSKLRNPEWLERWAASVTANTVYGALRLRRARPSVSWDTQLEPDLCVSRSDVEAMYVTLRVARAFERLSEGDQALLWCRWFEASTIDQIADGASWSRSTVKRRIQRAVSRFERVARKDPEVAARLQVVR